MTTRHKVFRKPGRLLRSTFVIIVSALLASCFSSATPADLKALERAKEIFGNDFDISLKSSIYIETRYAEETCPEEAKAVDLYEALLFGEGRAKRLDTVFTYLNLKTQSGRFCYQLAYDPASKKVELSSQAYY